MKYYHHEFERIEDYLHHRPPYLLIDQVVSLDDRTVVASTVVRPDAFFIQGHFPGAPILPGAMMQEMTTQTAGVLIAARYNPMEEFNTHDPYFNKYALGVLVKVNRARYRGFARPGDALQVNVTLNEQVGEMFDFNGEVICAGKRIMQNSFRLTNILSTTLQGNPDPAESVG